MIRGSLALQSLVNIHVMRYRSLHTSLSCTLLVFVFQLLPFNSQAQWAQQNPPAPGTPPVTITDVLYAVCTINDTLVGIAGYQRLVKTINGGNTWSVPVTVTGTPYYTLHAGDDSIYFSHAASSNAWRVKMFAKGGVSLSSGGPTYINDTYRPDLSTGYVVGLSGKIEKTTDVGNSWSVQSSGTTATLRGVYAAGGIIAYAVGDNSTILKTTNGGGTWTTTAGVPQVGQLNDVWFGNANTGVAVGNNGAVLRTTNAGGTWTQANPGVSVNLNDVCFSDAATVYACGSGGVIIKSINGGASWFSMNSGTPYDLHGIHFSSPTAGWCVGGSQGVASVILKYTGSGCSITAPTGIVTDVICPGDLNGAIDITPTGGTSPFIYSWSTGATTEDITGIAGGTYSVTIIDSLGCMGAASFAVNEPAAFAPGFSNTNVTCKALSNGAVNMNPSGGTGPYTFLWTNNATTEDLSGVPAGTYTCDVTDSAGCLFTVQATISEPSGITTTSSVSDVKCNGDSSGSATVIGAGGNGGFSYLWSIGGTSSTHMNLWAGNFSVTITDSKNCSFTENVTISQPPAFVVTYTMGPPSGPLACDGVINLNVSGATPPFTYLWGPASQSQTTSSATNLCDTTHCVDITDSAGCLADTCISFSLTALADIDFELSVWPNPNEGTFSISLPVADLTGAMGTVKDLSGREVTRFVINASLTHVNLPDVSSGMYLVQVRTVAGIFGRMVEVR